MPKRNLELTEEQDAFIEAMVGAGRYRNASEAVRDAVSGLQQRWQEDELKHELLHTQLQAGIQALGQGRFTEIADEELDAALDKLAADGAS